MRTAHSALLASRKSASRKLFVGALLVFSCIACFFSTSGHAAQADSVAQSIKAPTLQWRDRTLTNGLRTITIEDHSSPTVSVQVWYRVGSKDDPPGRSGFAHLFEHMMFKSTRYLKAEQFDRFTEDVGGMNNAFTADDVTVYQSVVPSNHLGRLLWAEAERMAHLSVDEANFKSERLVVEEELRQRVFAQPYGRLGNAIAQYSYAVHPYRRPGIGNIEELDAASLNDVVDFHRTYYRPDNAVLIVAGDFDANELDTLIDRYFKSIATPSKPIPRVTAIEPPRQQDQRHTVTAPNVPLPAVAMTWLAPPAAHADVPALKIASALLSSGDSSRLHEALVYHAQLAQSADFSTDFKVDNGLLIATAIIAAGKPMADVEQALLDQIAKLATGPIAPAELEKIKTQIVTQALVERQTPNGKALSIGDALLISGDAQLINSEIAALQAVNASDVQRVLRRWVIDAKKVTIDYHQAASGS